jgi:hypothetical protein
VDSEIKGEERNKHLNRGIYMKAPQGDDCRRKMRAQGELGSPILHLEDTTRCMHTLESAVVKLK